MNAWHIKQYDQYEGHIHIKKMLHAKIGLRENGQPLTRELGWISCLWNWDLHILDFQFNGFIEYVIINLCLLSLRMVFKSGYSLTKGYTNWKEIFKKIFLHIMYSLRTYLANGKTLPLCIHKILNIQIWIRFWNQFACKGKIG